MSTNYYIAAPGQLAEDYLHVGLLAGGMFTLRAHTQLGLVSFEAWVKHLTEHAENLVDEYDHPILLGAFLSCVERKRNDVMKGPRRGQYHNAVQLEAGQAPKPGTRFRDAQGYLLTDYEFS